MKSLLSSFVLFSLLSCTHSKEMASKETKPDNSKVVIIYECGACFGKCPIYSLTITGETHIAKFEGDKNTHKIGTFTKKIKDEEITKLVTAFETAKFNTFENTYLGPITDFPVKFITYTNNGTSKTIKERSNVPEPIITLEKLLKAYAENEEGWVKESTE